MSEHPDKISDEVEYSESLGPLVWLKEGSGTRLWAIGCGIARAK